MPSDSLFGHVALRFVSQQENLATEALAFVLGRSSAARHALHRTLRLASYGVAAPGDEELSFRTQAAGDDLAIPDLVGWTPRVASAC